MAPNSCVLIITLHGSLCDNTRTWRCASSSSLGKKASPQCHGEIADLLHFHVILKARFPVVFTNETDAIPRWGQLAPGH